VIAECYRPSGFDICCEYRRAVLITRYCMRVTNVDCMIAELFGCDLALILKIVAFKSHIMKDFHPRYAGL
jgi:hypothetical protein